MKLTKENKEIYICGDFNIDLLKIDNNENYHQFYNMLCSLRVITYNDKLPLVPGPLHPANPLFYGMEILKIYDVFKLQLAKFIFNCIHLTTPPIFYNWFKLITTVHNYNTRSTFFNIDHDHISNNLFIINARTTHYGLKLLKVSGPKLWNSIPNKIRSSQSLNNFKFMFKKYLIAQYVNM